MRVLRWFGIAVAALVSVVLIMDTFGGYLFDGPVGPIPGGAFRGAAVDDPNPDWSSLEQIIEIEIRPAKPWSLSVWNAVVDGELYVPSAKGASRRWPKVALEDPRIRVRAGGRIYDRRIERVTDEELIGKVRGVLSERYGLDRDPDAADDGLWIFHVAPR